MTADRAVDDFDVSYSSRICRCGEAMLRNSDPLSRCTWHCPACGREVR